MPRWPPAMTSTGPTASWATWWLAHPARGTWLSRSCHWTTPPRHSMPAAWRCGSGHCWAAWRAEAHRPAPTSAREAVGGRDDVLFARNHQEGGTGERCIGVRADHALERTTAKPALGDRRDHAL